MIISASRRTDIPAFYAPWFMGRLREGYVDVRNPMAPRRCSRVSLHPDVVDAIVFWTKNAEPMTGMLDTVTGMGYMYYFQYTLTPYGRDIERNLPEKARLIDNFRALSERLGKDRVVWRYDPVIGPPAFSPAWHEEAFSRMCEALHRYTDMCVISFMDPYAKVLRNDTRIAASVPDDETIREISRRIAPIAAGYGLPLAACAETADLSAYGIRPSRCIDPDRISHLLGLPLKATRDSGQREACGCMPSIDIGAYDTCPHGCAYCYATHTLRSAEERLARHDPACSCLSGPLGPEDILTERKMQPLAARQLTFL